MHFILSTHHAYMLSHKHVITHDAFPVLSIMPSCPVEFIETRPILKNGLSKPIKLKLFETLDHGFVHKTLCTNLLGPGSMGRSPPKPKAFMGRFRVTNPNQPCLHSRPACVGTALITAGGSRHPVVAVRYPQDGSPGILVLDPTNPNNPKN